MSTFDDYYDLDRDGELDFFEAGLMHHEQDVEMERLFRRDRMDSDLEEDPLFDEYEENAEDDLYCDDREIDGEVDEDWGYEPSCERAAQSSYPTLSREELMRRQLALLEKRDQREQERRRQAEIYQKQQDAERKKREQERRALRRQQEEARRKQWIEEQERKKREEEQRKKELEQKARDRTKNILIWTVVVFALLILFTISLATGY